MQWDQWRDLPIAEWPENEVLDLVHAFAGGVASARLAVSRICDADIAALIEKVSRTVRDQGPPHDSSTHSITDFRRRAEDREHERSRQRRHRVRGGYAL